MSIRRQFIVTALAVLGLVSSLHAQTGDTITVGTDATFPPMEFVDGGKRTGFDIELVEAIGKTLGKKI